jgi:NitT/TauT family transport system ATP-binding protein
VLSPGITGSSVSRLAETGRAGSASSPATGPTLRVSGLAKRYSDDAPPALTEIMFEVSEGELLAVVGPSGCGKTTLLRLLCGLTPATAGEVLYEGRPVLHPPREFAVVFQDYSRSLFPWLDVMGNVTFPLLRSGLARSERVVRAEAVLAEVGLHGVAHTYPWKLSGGMQQRVAIARALVSRPRVLLLDEPFASVDALTRADLQDLLLRIHVGLEHRRVTIVHVTHDIDEAVYLADRVLVLSAAPGRVVDVTEVSLGRARTQPTTRSSPEFLAARNRIHQMIGAKEVRP